MNIFKKLIRIFTTALSMFGLTGTNSFVPVQSPNAVKQAWVYDEETDTITSDNLIVLNDVAETIFNGVTYSISHGAIHMVGTWTGAAAALLNLSFKVYLTSGNTYTLCAFNSVPLSSDTRLRLLYQDIRNYDCVLSSINSIQTFTCNLSGFYNFYIRMGSFSSDNVFIIKPMLVEGSSVSTAWTPGGTYVNKTEYDILQEDYNNLLSSYNTLQENYNNLVTSHQNLQNEYKTLNSNYNTLNSEFEDLQASYNALQTQYNNLKTLYDNLVSTFNELNGSNAFEVSNLGPFVFVTRDGTTNKLPILQLPNFESYSLGSFLPLIYNADEVKYTFKTPVYFKQGTIVLLSTTHTYSHPVNVKISLYDNDNSLIGEFNITFDFYTVSLTGVYVGSFEFVSDVGNISSIVFTDISLNGELGVTKFELASDAYQRGYNNGYLARSNDYYQMLQQYNDEVALYNSLLEEYQAYKNKYNTSTEQTAFNNGVNSVGNATSGILTLIDGVAGVPITILNGLAPFAIWNVPVIQFIITILFFALIIWLVRKFI